MKNEFTATIATPNPTTVEANRAKMKALIERCRGGQVAPIVVPANVYFRDGSQPEPPKVSSRLRFIISADTVRLWYEEYKQPGQSVKSVAERHGLSAQTVRNRFKDYGFNLKNRKALFGENGAGLK